MHPNTQGNEHNEAEAEETRTKLTYWPLSSELMRRFAKWLKFEASKFFPVAIFVNVFMNCS